LPIIRPNASQILRSGISKTDLGKGCQAERLLRGSAPVRTTPSSTPAPVMSVDPAILPDFALFRECEECPQMVALPAGSFNMGVSTHRILLSLDRESECFSDGFSCRGPDAE